MSLSIMGQQLLALMVRNISLGSNIPSVLVERKPYVSAHYQLSLQLDGILTFHSRFPDWNKLFW